VLALISGGASAMATVPAPGLTLAELADTVARVMAGGADITAINAVRKHLSAIKGGQLAAASPVPVRTLIASDVVGDDPSAVGSGPTVPDPTTFDDACAAVTRHAGWDRIPQAARERLRAGQRGEVPETPRVARPGDRVTVVAGTGALLDAAIAAAAAGGADARVLDRGVTGDVSAVAGRLAAAVTEAVRDANAGGRPVCLAAGGEPTVALPERPGVGGRAHQLALLVARRIAGARGVAVLCAGSDGIDGTSAAAGAVAGGDTWRRVEAAGMDPAAAVTACDAATALGHAGAQVVTGRTGRNHADLMLVVAEPGALAPS
jgi:glycerate-2-kinase